MVRVVVSTILLVIVSSVAAAQEGVPYPPKVNDRYFVKGAGLNVFTDAKSAKDYAACLSDEEDEFLATAKKSGKVQLAVENTLLEIVRIEPRTGNNPSGLLEVKRIMYGGNTDTVYLTPGWLVPDVVTPTMAKDAAAPPKAAIAGGKKPAQTPVVRTWKAAEGNFEVRADLMANESDKVVLKRKNDGKEITVATDKLSMADRQYLAALRQLEGTWEFVSVEAMGSPVADAPKMTLQITLSSYKSSVGDADQDTGDLVLDPSKMPKTIDLVSSRDGKRLLGIYQFDGETLKICNSESNERPADFATKGTSFGLITLKKAQK